MFNPVCRLETPAPRAGEISIPFQVFIWPVDVTTTKFGLRLFKEQAQRRKFFRVLAHRTKVIVRAVLSFCQHYS